MCVCRLIVCVSESREHREGAHTYVGVRKKESKQVKKTNCVSEREEERVRMREMERELKKRDCFHLREREDT